MLFERARRKRQDGSQPHSAVPRTALAVVTGLAVLLGVIAIPALASESGDAPDPGPPAQVSSGAPSTTAVKSPTTVATEAVEATLVSLTDEERLAMQLYFMSAEEREAFSRFLAPPAPAPAPAPPPPPAPEPVEVEVVPVEPVAAAPVGSVWDDLAYCEAGGNWAHPPVGGHGYSGGLMFLPSTWNAYGGGEFASQAYLASRDAQIVVAERILADHGGSYRAWPGCRAKLGLP